MTKRRKPHPSLLLVLVPIAVTTLAAYVVSWGWEELAAGMTGKTGYLLLRAAPLPALLFGPLAGLLTVWALPLHRRRPVAIASLVCFLAVAGFYALREYGRLVPVIGERYRVDKEIVHHLPFDPNDLATWGKGGKAPLLTYKQDFDSTHMLFFAGSGGYKTTSNVVPTALRYRGPLICLDPSTEVAPMVAEHRTSALGREVMVLDPTNPIMGFNVLDGIEASKQKEEDIVGIAHMLLSESLRFESSTGSYFQN